MFSQSEVRVRAGRSDGSVGQKGADLVSISFC
jgi:hypothetical protein